MKDLLGNLGSLFWLFIIIIAVLPMVQQRLLEATRVRTLRRLEIQRGSRVIALIHRQETMKILGFPLARFINIEDSEQVLRAIRLTPENMPIDLILHTPGGLVLAAEQTAKALASHTGKVTVFVPHYAMSGGMLLALAADEVWMDPHAVLGPVDPQLGQWPAASILAAVDRKPVAEVDDQTLILADLARKASLQLEEFVEGLLASKMDQGKAAILAKTLTEGRWTHDYPIFPPQAEALGLPVKWELPRAIYDLMDFYPQPLQARPSVQYIPIPYRPSGPDSKSSGPDKSR